MTHNDQPITHPAQDELRRADFALTLARAIDGLSVGSESFVIALTGEWGSGKTSVLNLIRRYILHIDMARASGSTLYGEATSVPKSVSDLESMAEIFERIEGHIIDLEAANKDTSRWVHASRLKDFQCWLNSASEAENADRYFRLKSAAQALQHTYVIQFSPWLIPGRIELAAALLNEVGRAVAISAGDEAKQAFGALLNRISEFGPVIGAGFDVMSGAGVGSIFGASSSLFGKTARRLTSGPTLEELRERLKRILRNLENKRILIIIDDLDRLLPLEATGMVSLIKSLGDLPNVIYLLSYDEPQLSALIQSVVGIDGHRFLQKIVQYPVAVPPVGSDDLTRMLLSDLGRIFGNSIVDRIMERLRTAWREVLQYFVTTPRDVRRLTNCLAISWPGLADYTDPIDLIVIEALRLFDHGAYQVVRRERISLGGTP
jgi:predicted KAP-like P-loop ATPase